MRWKDILKESRLAGQDPPMKNPYGKVIDMAKPYIDIDEFTDEIFRLSQQGLKYLYSLVRAVAGNGPYIPKDEIAEDYFYHTKRDKITRAEARILKTLIGFGDSPIWKEITEYVNLREEG